MKVCILCRSYIYHKISGGMEIQLKYLIDFLLKKNHKIILITTEFDKEVTNKNNNLEIIQIKVDIKGRYCDKYFSESLKHFNKIFQNIDIIYYVSGSGGYFNNNILENSIINKYKKNNIPSVITFHNEIKNNKILNYVNSVVFSHEAPLRKFEKMFGKKFNSKIVTSIPTSSDCNFNKLVNVRNKYNIENNKKLICFVCKVIKYNNKGFGNFVKIIDKLKTNDNIKSIIVGDVSKEIKEKHSSPKVIFTGRLDINEVYNILYSSNFLIHPTNWATGGFDGIISESLLAGTPVISTTDPLLIGESNCPEDKETIWYLNLNNYVNEAISIIQKIEKNNILQQKCINKSKNFNQKTTMQKYEDLFLNLIKISKIK